MSEDVQEEDLLIENQRNQEQDEYISSQQSSKSYSIHLNLNQVQNPVLEALHLQNRQLRLQNDHLRAANQDLLLQLNQGNQQIKLKKQLKKKEKQIQKLVQKVSSIQKTLISQMKKASEKQIQKKQISQSRDYKDEQLIKTTNQKEINFEKSQQYFQQNIKFNKKILDQIPKLKNIIQELNIKISNQQNQLRWAYNLAIKIVQMSQKLSFLNKQQVIQQQWSLRRKCKASWRYIKHILGYFTSIN